MSYSTILAELFWSRQLLPVSRHGFYSFMGSLQKRVDTDLCSSRELLYLCYGVAEEMLQNEGISLDWSELVEKEA